MKNKMNAFKDTLAMIIMGGFVFLLLCSVLWLISFFMLFFYTSFGIKGPVLLFVGVSSVYGIMWAVDRDRRSRPF
jgi:hypothetical protein